MTEGEGRGSVVGRGPTVVHGEGEGVASSFGLDRGDPHLRPLVDSVEVIVGGGPADPGRDSGSPRSSWSTGFPGSEVGSGRLDERDPFSLLRPLDRLLHGHIRVPSSSLQTGRGLDPTRTFREPLV